MLISIVSDNRVGVTVAFIYTHTHTRAHTYIYIYIYISFIGKEKLERVNWYTEI
jgi:hypothetical protein